MEQLLLLLEMEQLLSNMFGTQLDKLHQLLLDFVQVIILLQ